MSTMTRLDAALDMIRCRDLMRELALAGREIPKPLADAYHAAEQVYDSPVNNWPVIPGQRPATDEDMAWRSFA